MIKYITENDKNGKARYYKVIDGKKKVVSRAEYEANSIATEPINSIDSSTTGEVNISSCDASSELQLTFGEISSNPKAEPEETTQSESVILNADSEIGTILASLVNSILCAGSKKPKAKITRTKKFIVVNYQKCMVLSLAVSESGTVTAIRFKGTDKENRKEVRAYPFNNSTNISDFKDEIVKQIEFIDREHSVKNRSDEQESA